MILGWSEEIFISFALFISIAVKFETEGNTNDGENEEDDTEFKRDIIVGNRNSKSAGIKLNDKSEVLLATEIFGGESETVGGLLDIATILARFAIGADIAPGFRL